ncbi:MAG: sigma-70 family RNA polymerase sigma factor [Anaerolineales bacterium]
MGVDRELDWVEQARRGDEHAFAQLVAAYQLPVYNLAYRMLGTSAEAEDATHEAFIRVWSKLDTYDPSRKLSSWVLSVASHYCIDRLRRRRGGQVSMEEIAASRWLPADDPKPEDRTLTNERDARVRRLLQFLQPQYRLVIILRYWHDKSYGEIAEITGTTESAVKSRLHRAREAMAALLAAEEPSPAVSSTDVH